MNQLSIRGHIISIDVADYLESNFLDSFPNAKWTSEKLICASPFRPDNHPSFYVNLDNDYTGFWGDSGGGLHGFLPELVALLRGISREEAEDELIELYEPRQGDNIAVTVSVKLDTKQSRLEIPDPNFSEYLEGRHITAKAQEDYKTSQYAKTLNLPYLDGSGSCRAVKHRSTDRKSFFYTEGGELITNLLFGAHLAYQKLPKTLVICEAEIDAMTWYGHAGHVSVSLGNAGVSEKQAELLKKIGAVNVVLACDNDKAGRSANFKLKAVLGSSVNYYEPEYLGKKDLNEFYTSFGKLPNLLKVDSNLIKL